MAELLGFNEPTQFGDQISQGLRGLSAQPVLDLSTQQQAAQGFQERQFSGAVEPVGPFEAAWKGLGVFGGAPVAAQQLRNERAKPVAARLLQLGRQALTQGDYATAERVSQGLIELSSSVPEYGRLADSFVNEVTSAKSKIAGNTAILQVYQGLAGDNPKAQQAIATVAQNMAALDPAQTRELLKEATPHIVATEQFSQAFDKFTAKPIGERNIFPALMKPTDLTAPQREALALRNIPESEYTDLLNRYNNDKPLKRSELERLGGIQQAIGQEARTEVSTRRLPLDLQYKYGVETPEGVATVTRVPSEGGKALSSLPFNAQTLPAAKQALLLNEASKTTDVSPAGAIGEAQIMPSTAKPYVDKLTGKDTPINVVKEVLKDQKLNSRIMDMHLQDLMEKHPNWTLHGLGAAYYSGEGNVNDNGSIKNPDRRPTKDGKPYGPTVQEYADKFVQNYSQVAGQGGRVSQATPQAPTAVQQAIQPQPNTSARARTEIVSQPNVGAQTGQDVFQEVPGEGPIARGKRYEAFTKQREQFQQTVGTQQAQTQEEPAKTESIYFKLDENGKMVGYSGPRKSHSQMMQEGYAQQPFPTGTKMIASYNAALADYEALKKEVVTIPDNAIDRFSRGIAMMLGRGANIPGVGKVGGLPSILTPEDIKFAEKAIAFAQNAEVAMNPSGADNANIGAIKNILASGFTSRAQVLAALDGIMNTVRDRQTNFMRTLNPGSVPAQLNPIESQVPVSPKDLGISKAMRNFEAAATSLRDTASAKVALMDVAVNEQMKTWLGQWADSILKDIQYKQRTPVNSEVSQKVLQSTKDKGLSEGKKITEKSKENRLRGLAIE